MNDERDEGSFDQRLNQARERQGLAEPAATPAGEEVSSAWNLGARIGVELAAALVVGGIIGYALDRWLHTTPIFLLVFFVLGAAAGMLNVWRLISPPSQRPPGK